MRFLDEALVDVDSAATTGCDVDTGIITGPLVDCPAVS